MGREDSFVHLHVHTDFSKLDGMQTVDEVAKFAAQDGQPAAAITDHGVMSGYIQFEKACLDAGIRPIPGIEAYHVDSYERVRKQQDRSRNHMLLLGVSDEGYRNLLELSSRAHLEQFYTQPLTDDAMLEEHAKGVVMTSGCLGSPINQAILRGEDDVARELLGKYRDMMEPGHYFAEVQVHDFKEQQQANRVLIPMALDMGIPLVATQDAHYANSRRAEAHEKMLAIQSAKPLSDPNRFRFASYTNYMATAAEMRRMVDETLYPGACDNTLLIAEMASDVSRQAGSRYLIPEFTEARKYEGGEREMLRRLVVEGAKKRYGEHFGKTVAERVDYELGVIHDMGFDGYFLIVWDLVKWAKEQGIYVGPGRGSVAGSIVSYALDISTVDPLKYNLFFERFLNPGRKSMPDIDLDFEPERREEVRNYLASKYGRDHVAYIATQGKFHGRSAIKAAARIHEIPAKVANDISSTYPKNGKLKISQVAGHKDDLPRHDDPDKEADLRREWEDGRDFRRAISRGGQKILDAVDDAADIEGYIQNFGKHAAGVLITPKPLTNYVPLTWVPKDGDDLATCGYDKDDAESIGGLKMDLLGLINLTAIRRCVEQIEHNTGRPFDIANIPLDDKKTFALLQRADTIGVFQLASEGMQELLRRVYPTSFEDLSAVLALYRPGPMGTDMHHSYADRKNGREPVTVEHQDMLKIAGDTHGLIVYQEQMLALAQHFAGFSAGEADTLRKATGKKDADLLATQEVKFKEGMRDRGYDARLADKLWAKLPSFAEYSFNKSHTAAYGMISYQTAYLKANYPAEYAAACVDTLKDPSVHMQWARHAGITFDVPDINESLRGSRALDGKIRLGLSRIKGLGAASVDAILGERNANGPFISVSDFLVRVASTGKVNRSAVAALIDAGALDSLAVSRGQMTARLDDLLKQARDSVVATTEWTDTDDDDDLLGGMQTSGVVLDFDPRAEETLTLSERIRAQVMRLGVFLGTHPMALFEKHLLGRIPDVSEVVSPDIALGEVTVHGVVVAIESKKTRRSVMTTVTLESASGYSLDAKFFGEDVSDIVNAGLGSLVVIDGVLQEDEWAKAQRIGGDDGDADAEQGQAPRELMVDDHLVIPLAALDDADAVRDHHHVVITLSDDSVVGEVARSLAGKLSPGLRVITVVTSEGSTPLPQMVGESAAQIAGLVAHIPEAVVSEG